MWIRKLESIIMFIIALFSFISSIFTGWYGAAIGTGVLGIWFGVILFRLAKLNTIILFYLIIEVLLVWIAFSLAYCEFLRHIDINTFVLSIQNLFHFTIISTPQQMENSIIYKILASIEGFIGYLLVVSGVVLLFKGHKVDKTGEKNEHFGQQVDV